MLDQLFVGRSKPTRENFQRVRNDPGLGIKPRGGLWTSTFSEATGSGWVEWCLAESYGIPKNYQWHAWMLVPAPEALILEIDSYEDLRRTLEDDGYGIRPAPLWNRGMSLNYEKLADHFDAIHLTDNGQWKTRLSLPHTLYGYDCESTLWLRWQFDWKRDAIVDLGIQTWGTPPPVPKAGVIRRARRDL